MTLRLRQASQAALTWTFLGGTVLRVLEPEPGSIGRPPSAREERGAGAAAANAGRMRRKPLDEAGLLLLLPPPPLEAMMALRSISGHASSLSSESLGAERIAVSDDPRRAARQAVFLLFASSAGGRQGVGGWEGGGGWGW